MFLKNQNIILIPNYLLTFSKTASSKLKDAYDEYEYGNESDRSNDGSV